jgi:hypothetical protein
VSVGQGTVHLLDDDLFHVFAGLSFLAGDDIPHSSANGSADFHPVIDPSYGVERKDFADGTDQGTHDGVSGQVIDLEVGEALADARDKLRTLFGRLGVVDFEQHVFELWIELHSFLSVVS